MRSRCSSPRAFPGRSAAPRAALWQELAGLLTDPRHFRVWPFEGSLSDLLRASPVVLGEIYPRAAYGTALSDEPLERRARLQVAKTKAPVRQRALTHLQSAAWFLREGITLHDADAAQASEDVFDACVTAIALLRCVLEGAPLHAPVWSATVEGGMLGTGSVTLEHPEQAFGRAIQHGTSTGGASAAAHSGIRHLELACPIPGCGKKYSGGRGGWDAHVGSPKTHPHWHPHLVTASERKQQFRAEFPTFLRQSTD